MGKNKIIKPWELNICPVSGLPITRRREWTDLAMGSKNYRVTITLIGQSILHVKTWGYSEVSCTKQYFELLEQIAEDYLPYGGQYTLIEDYSEHLGASADAKNYYINYQKNNTRIKGLIFYGTSAFFKLLIKMGKRIANVKFPVEIMDDYKSAIDFVLEMRHDYAKIAEKKPEEELKKDGEIFDSRTYRCPVSGLPVVTKEEWMNIDCGEGYCVSFALIGDRILLVSPKGNGGKNGMQRLVDAQYRIVKEMNLEGKKYVELKDYSGLTGKPTKETRKQFGNHLIKMRDEDILLGFWGFNANIFVKWAMNVGTSLYRTTFPVKIVNTYEDAITNAIRVISEESNRGLIERENVAEKRWSVEFDGLMCNFGIIDSNVLFYKAIGNLKEHHVIPVFEKYNKVIENSGVANKGYYYVIADWGGLGKSNWKVRKMFIDEFAKSNQKYQCKLYIVYGLSMFLQAVVGVSKQFFSAPLAIAKNYEDAKIILGKKRKKIDSEKIAKTEKEGKVYSQTQMQGYVDDLMKFMGKMNWDKEGIDFMEIDEGNPFKILFESMALIKQDFDTILNEKDKAEKDISDKNKFNALRAEIWKIASNKNFTENELIQKLLNRVGPSIGASRACYNKFLGPNVYKSDLECVLEWCDEGVKPTKGAKMPSLLVRHFINKNVFEITPDSALNLIPETFRLALKPVLSLMVRSQDLASTSIVPYYLNDKLMGWFSFDVCRNNIKKRSLSEDVKSIAYEMINIVSTYVMQKRAEDALRNAYDGLDIKIQERTRELSNTNIKLKEMEAFKENLTNMVVHDMKNILMAISGGLRMLERKNYATEGKDYDNKDIALIKTDIDDLMRMISNILDISKMEEDKLKIRYQLIEFNYIILCAIKTQEVLAHEMGIKLNMDIDVTKELEFFVDPEIIERVVVNLVNNAIKHSDQNSTITITTRLDENKSNLIVCVENQGYAIPKKYHDKIFEKFAQLEMGQEAYHIGKGLGLTFCKMAVESHEGKIWVESKDEKSNQFKFSLPVKKAEKYKKAS